MTEAESRQVHPGFVLASRLSLGLLTTAVLAMTSPAHAESIAPAAPAAEVHTAPARRPLVQEHSLGFGYHALIMRTESSDQYAIQGPAIAYNYGIGRTWGFHLRVAAFFPLLGNMSGPSGDFDGSLVEIYDQHRYGVDLLLMGSRHISLAPRLELTAAAGPHLQWFSLAGSEYSPVETASAGVGGLGKLDYLINRWLSVSTQLAIGLDLFDLVDHRNAADLIVPLSWTFAFDARY